MSATLPDHILKLMKPEDRATLGKEGRTAAEVMAEAEERYEEDIHRGIIAELNRREFPYLRSSMKKRSTLPIGWPDFTIFLPGGKTWLCEVKAGNGQPRPEQKEKLYTLQKLGHRVSIPRSLAEFIAELKELL